MKYYIKVRKVNRSELEAISACKVPKRSYLLIKKEEIEESENPLMQFGSIEERRSQIKSHSLDYRHGLL